jgi:hypothetical protein
MPQIQGVKGEAVVSYCEPLTTLEMGYHPAKGGKGKQNEGPKKESYFIGGRDTKFQIELRI